MFLKLIFFIQDDVSTCPPSTLSNYPPKLTAEIPTLIYNFSLQLASEPDFSDFLLNQQKTDLFRTRGASVFLAKLLSWIWSQKEIDLVTIWFLDNGMMLNKIKMLKNVIFSFHSRPFLGSPI